MKYYNIELSKAAAKRLQHFLYNLSIEYEISEAGPYYHFEILTDASGAETINNFLDSVII